MNYITLLLSASIWVVSAHVAAEIYTWKDEQGQIHYSDKKPAKQDAKTMGKLKTNVMGKEAREGVEDAAKTYQHSGHHKQASRVRASNNRSNSKTIDWGKNKQSARQRSPSYIPPQPKSVDGVTRYRYNSANDSEYRNKPYDRFGKRH